MSQQDASQLRLFLALQLPESTKELLYGISLNLQKAFKFFNCQASWTSAQTMHLTLAFLGMRQVSDLEILDLIMRRTCEEIAPPRIEIKRLGAFPGWHAPKILWAGVRDRSHQLVPLHHKLELRLCDRLCGYQPDQHPFHPHLTLARFRSLKGTAAVEKVVQAHSSFRFGPIEIPKLTLFQSELHPDGAIHTPLKEMPFIGVKDVSQGGATG